MKSLHDSLYWNLTEEEKIHRLRMTGLLAVIVITVLLLLFAVLRFYGHI